MCTYPFARLTLDPPGRATARLKQTPWLLGLGLLALQTLLDYRHFKLPRVARSPETTTASLVKPQISKSIRKNGSMMYRAPIRERLQVFSDTGLQHGNRTAFIASRARSAVRRVLVFACSIGCE